mgnify:CR=1 FL=1
MVYVELPDLNSVKWFADEDSVDGAIERVEQARVRLAMIDWKLKKQQYKLHRIRDDPIIY